MMRSNKRFSGFTLKELVIAMSVGSFLMVSAIGVLTQSFRSVNTSRHRTDDDRTFFRLSRSWRNDSHSATSASSEDESITFDMGGERTVRFDFRDASISRIETQSGGTIARQTFQWKLPKSSQFQLDQDANIVRLHVKQTVPESPDLSPPIWRKCQAVIGLRKKHESGSLQSEAAST